MPQIKIVTKIDQNTAYEKNFLLSAIIRIALCSFISISFTYLMVIWADFILVLCFNSNGTYGMFRYFKKWKKSFIEITVAVNNERDKLDKRNPNCVAARFQQIWNVLRGNRIIVQFNNRTFDSLIEFFAGFISMIISFLSMTNEISKKTANFIK